MSSQKNLMSFFKPVPKKRSSTEANFVSESTDDKNDQKKPKLDVESIIEKTEPAVKVVEEKPKLEVESISEKTEPAVKILEEKTVSCEESQDLKKNPDDINACSEEEKTNSKENDPTATNILLNTPPNKTTQEKRVMSPFGMLTSLQCMARIKSQVAKTPALHHSIGSTWFFALQSEFQKPYFAKLSEFITRERKNGTVYPPADQVWTWTTKVPIKDIKVVILGQDPYHNPGQAHGLCFSVPKGVPPPPSLVNMYKELADDIPGFTAPRHGYLEGWAEQGVLLLNACLTVRANSPNSHKDQGWEQLTDAVIKYISEHNRNVVFLLWGAYAQKKGSVVDKKKHHILKTVHPSPLSAHRGFFKCKHFSKCNEFLVKVGKKPVDWSKLP